MRLVANDTFTGCSRYSREPALIAAGLEQLDGRTVIDYHILFHIDRTQRFSQRARQKQKSRTIPAAIAR